MKNIVAKLLFLMLFVCPALFGHTLVLKNKKIVRGKIVNQNKTEIHMEIGGKVVVFQKSDISEVDYADRIQEPKPVVKKPKPEPEKPKSIAQNRPLNGYDLAWRSMILPGWGQYKIEKKRWSYIEGGATFVALLYAGSTYVQSNSEKKVYESAILTNLALIQPLLTPGADPVAPYLNFFALSIEPFNKYQTTIDTANNAFWLLGIVYAAQLWHSWSLGQKNLRSEKPVMLDMSMSREDNLFQKGTHASLSLTFKF